MGNANFRKRSIKSNSFRSLFFNNVQDVYRYFKNLELRDFDSDMVNRAVYKTLYQFLDDQSEYIINKN